MNKSDYTAERSEYIMCENCLFDRRFGTDYTLTKIYDLHNKNTSNAYSEMLYRCHSVARWVCTDCYNKLED